MKKVAKKLNLKVLDGFVSEMFSHVASSNQILNVADSLEARGDFFYANFARDAVFQISNLVSNKEILGSIKYQDPESRKQRYLSYETFNANKDKPYFLNNLANYYLNQGRHKDADSLNKFILDPIVETILKSSLNNFDNFSCLEEGI